MDRYRWRVGWGTAPPSASPCRWRRHGCRVTRSRWAEMSEPMEMPTPDPKQPVDFVPQPDAKERALPPEPAKLKIYLGAAPGVGKTYQMLEDAHLMRKQGIDVVIGFVEPHKRADTEAMIRDLEVIPQRAMPYRSVVLHEMDLTAILARHPQVCIVDELAHTNVPGSKNRKRYEDVLELLDEGIDVMT